MTERFVRVRVLRALVLGVTLFASLAFLSSPGRAAGGVTGGLRGTLVDERTGKAVGGVHVTVVSPSGTFRTVADERGFFSFLQLPTDTYAVSFERAGYQSYALSGVVVLGDQTQSVGNIRLTPALRTIGQVRVAGRASSAFQPNQTVDEFTFSGARVDQALGEKGSTDFNSLVLSAPGVIKTAEGSLSAISIRGSAGVEIGYQFDGVDYRGSFFDENPNQGFLNGIGGGKGALQVVSGAGDATQGGIGAGVVNIVPGRGSYPGDGFVSFDVGAPYFEHALNFQYGVATKDGHFSDFISTRSLRSVPQYAPFGRDASDLGQYYGTSYSVDDDVLNNFYYRFGKNESQQIQVLTDWLDHRAFGNYGGLQYANYYPYNPFAYANFSSDTSGNAVFGCLQPAACFGGGASSGAVAAEQFAQYRAIIPYVPGVPRTYQPVRSPEQYIYGPTNFLKIGYSRSLGNATALNAFFYNWGGLVANNITGSSSDLTDGTAVPGYNNAGGRKVGFQTQVTMQAGQQHTLTFVAKFENGFPYWKQQNFGNTMQGFFVGRGQDQSNFPSGLPTSPGGGFAQPNGPRIEDWFLPLQSGQPVGPGNPCVGPAIDNNFDPTKATGIGCYLYSYLLAHGLWKGTLPNIPTTGFDYNHSDFQQFGIGLRDQWSPSAKLHIDYGVRLDGQNLRWNGSPFNLDPSNTADVGTGYAKLSDSYLHPKFLQPRLSISFNPIASDSFRGSYGRSVSFYFGQTAGTPTNAAYIDPVLYRIPAKDAATIDPAAGRFGPACGSGWHGPGANQNGTYVQNPYVYFSGSGTLNAPGYYFKCPNYASSVYWTFDQGYSAPDIGGQQPATYSNYDLAWSHAFKNGFATRLTSYWRRGYNTYQTVLLNAGPPNPVTGQQTAGSFQEQQVGVQKAFGLEFLVTTPERPYGLSGFLSANYINELTSTPPVSGADSLPLVAQYLYQSGTLFHQSFLPPVSARAGLAYKFHNGVKVNPIFTFDGGEPFGVGRDALGFVNGVLYHLPTGNVGVSTPYAGPNLPNQSYNATCYVDPAYAGNYFKPRDFACRGFSEPALAGQAYTRPRLYADLDAEIERGRFTVGAYVTNVFDNYRAQPRVNTLFQPVATGQAGLQTGKVAGGSPVNYDGTPNPLYLAGGRNASAYDEYWLPYSRTYVPGRTYRVYAQIKL